ncbi:pyridoxine/pyridoxamine 5'-phosphate oxidase [Novosphingobium endophyticum]|uniref:Pyridoxine/pyridoxamine 5'-phosphate oxidase n=1 Tax=Novosphingobium endophyticum TaxID=1955250 RepID=A0A916TQZ7_9SPHN|nr:pyridoxamine 5'-phosphate oxidase [Novosphingobium endophyticum]GGB90071.1 pyridoxine/pyridoxamine 5'-phosphate oxidase [Novosphingobium endophyticum]
MDADEAREVIPHGDPFTLFQAWYDEARETEPGDSNAMALATATPGGVPSVRMVLLKGHGPAGFVFYTNGRSRKGREIAENPNVALLFHWKSLRRQIRVEGAVQPVSGVEADAYFRSRARDSQLGAVASDQSAPLDRRETFLHRYEAARDAFAGLDVARPAHWGGYRVVPKVIEFWHDRPHRLHERRRFDRDVAADGTAGEWTSTLLYP